MNQEPERIWVYYRLYEQYGNSDKEVIDSRPARVSVDAVADVFKLKDEIKERRADERIPRTTDLSVYKPDGQGVLEELFGEVALSNHGPDSQHPLKAISVDLSIRHLLHSTLFLLQKNHGTKMLWPTHKTHIA